MTNVSGNEYLARTASTAFSSGGVAHAAGASSTTAASRPLTAPVVPAIPAPEVAREYVAEKPEKETVSVAASDSGYDSAFGDDDLDIPDFLK
jgi:hypothetical protein